MSEGVEVVVVAEVVGDRVAVHPLVSRLPPRRMARPQMEVTSRSRWFLGRPSSALDMVSPCWPAPGAQDQGPRWRARGRRASAARLRSGRTFGRLSDRTFGRSAGGAASLR